MSDKKIEISERISRLSYGKRVEFLKEIKKRGVDYSQLPIVRRADAEEVFTSFAQRRLWFLWNLEPQSTAYHIGMAFRVAGKLDEIALSKAFEYVVQRHEALRTVFRSNEEGQAVQMIIESAPVVVDVRNVTEVDLASEVERIQDTPFDLTQGPLFRAVLLKESVGRSVLAVVMHHIVSDDWTLRLLVNEWIQAYQAAIAGCEPKLTAQPLQYADYAVWQRAWMDAGERDRQLAYWKGRLGDGQSVLNLQTDHPRRPDGRYREGNFELELDAEVTKGLKAWAQVKKGTLFVALLAGFQALLHRYSGQDDIRVGVPIANRHQPGTEGVVGVFINTQVLQATFDSQTTLEKLLEQVRTTALEAQEHQDLPFEELVEVLQPERSFGRSPLFQVMFNHLRGDEGNVNELSGLVLDVYHGERAQAAKFELTLTTREALDGRVSVSLGYARELFDATTIERMAGHYVQLLKALSTLPQQAVGEVELLGAAEQAQLASWGVNDARYPQVQPIHRLIEAQVQQRPEAAAVVFGDEELSYGELNERTNRLAHRLIGLGVGAEVRVGVALERSSQLVVTLLAILKAGGAYVPLDPDYPADRLAYMVGDSGIGLLMTHSALSGRVPVGDGVQVVEVDRLDLAGEPDGNPDVPVTGENLAYVIYTSGSTGKPKGAANRHSALCNRLRWMQQAYGLGDSDTVLQKTPYSFDVSVWEFFWPLITGARLAVANPGDHRDPQRLVEQIRRNKVTTMHFVPSMLQAFLAYGGIEACTSLKRIVCSGEALPVEAQASVFKRLPQAALYNLYGPTEAAIDVTHWTCRDDGSSQVPIGRPIAETKTCVLDGHLNLVPQGVAGELYLGGAGLARGYLNRPSLTAERFVADPFDDEGGRLYRTGDLVKWNAEGQLEYLGRLDHQVKVRGFRIELGEIESRLLAQEEVREAVVVAGEGPGGTRLVGYVSLREGREIDSGALRERLGRDLPDYMVPSVIVVLDALPLNANGKIDRKALPAPEFTAEGEYEAPVGELEVTLAGIWAEVLQVERVGRNDDFFQLGGHSLLALKLLERIRGKGCAVQVRTLFDYPKLGDFARAIGQGGQRRDVEVPPNLIPMGCKHIEPQMLTLVTLTDEQLRRIEGAVPGGARNIQDIYPLAPLQEGILFHHLLQEQGDVYITCHGLSFDTKQRLERFIESFNRVIERHDILRTAVHWEGLDEPVQVVQRRAELEVQWVREVGDLASYRIDVRQAPLIHALAAYDEGAQRWQLELPAHHMVLDHTTLELVIGEIALVQQGRDEELPEPVPFRQFVTQARLGVGREEHEAYFRRELGDVEEPTTPFGLLDVQGDGSRIEEERSELDPELAQAIRAQAKKHGVSAAALFHLAWALVLARTTGRDDVVFGTMLFGRMQSGEGADRALGMFLNMLPLRVRMGGRSIGQCLKEVQGGLTELLHHEHAPMALAQRCSGLPAGTPLFTAMLNYRHSLGGKPEDALSWNGIELAKGIERTNYPFGISVDDTGEGYQLVAHIDESIGAKRVCEWMLKALNGIVVAHDWITALTDIDLLGHAEHECLVRWGVNGTRYPKVLLIHQLIEAQAQQRPEAAAVVFGDEELSYGELKERANRLAHRLIGLGVGAEVRVGVALERSSQLVVTLLAILKAGGAYVPLDPDYPADRLAYMVGDSGIGLLMTHSALSGRVPVGDGVQVVEIDRLDLADEPEGNPAVPVSGENLAYVIYTSGSTGMPKGVAVRHAAVSNCMQWMQQAYELALEESVLHKAPFGFDVSVWELFWPLTVGARLVVAAPGEHRDVERLMEVIREQRVTAVNFVPTMLKAFLAHEGSQECTELRHIMCGGEAVGADLQRDLVRRLPATKLHDLYGPTETTIHVTHWTCGENESSLIPIGRPITDSEAYVLDGGLNLVPQGMPGELYIGGEGLARGYLNRPALTAEKFVADPFDAQGGGRLYRTGDLVKWNAEGQLEYLGRLDHQVKVRGFRIELGEIEARLLAQKEVREAVVVAGEGPSGTRLVGYVSPQVGQAIDAGDLRERLGRELPDYMVPSVLMVLQALPLNANGKIDRKALPAPEFGVESEYEAPVGELEETLAGIWADVLKVPLESVGRHSNFFELGGDSISAIKVIALAKSSALQNFDLKLYDLMQWPTVAMLSAYGTERYRSLVPLNSISADRKNLFCIHPLYGGIFDYRPLANFFQEKLNIYGFVCPMLANVEVNYSSLDDLAEDYARIIINGQPKGNYNIIGWSIGGMIAAKIASKLERLGKTVDFLGLVDPTIPKINKEMCYYDGRDWKMDFCEQYSLIVPGAKINPEDIPDVDIKHDMAGVVEIIKNLAKVTSERGYVPVEPYAGMVPEELASMFVVARRIKAYVDSAGAFSATKVAPSFWWCEERDEWALDNFETLLGGRDNSNRSRVNSGHREIVMNFSVLNGILYETCFGNVEKISPAILTA